MNIAFFLYRRPDLTHRVFDVIAASRPSRLLVVADGPKHDEEADLCAETRKIVERVDWPCEVLTNFADSNMGCRRRISSGIDWVFSLVEEAIIVEDDCLPHPTFFPYCQELLERYRDDDRVADIAGEYGLPRRARCKESYFASHYGSIWGWATWRRAWQLYDVEMRDWPEFRDRGLHRHFVYNRAQANLLAKRFDEVYESRIDTWDLQWGFTRMKHDLYSLVPSVNLVSNIGFRNDASITVADNQTSLADRSTSTMRCPLKHPRQLRVRHAYDRAYLENVALRLPSRWDRVMRSLFNRHLYGRVLRSLPVVGGKWSHYRRSRKADKRGMV